MVALLALRRRGNPPRPGEEEPEEDEEEAGAEAVAVAGLLATKKARPLLMEPAKLVVRTARTRSRRLIRRNANEAC